MNGYAASFVSPSVIPDTTNKRPDLISSNRGNHLTNFALLEASRSVWVCLNGANKLIIPSRAGIIWYRHDQLYSVRQVTPKLYSKNHLT